MTEAGEWASLKKELEGVLGDLIDPRKVAGMEMFWCVLCEEHARRDAIGFATWKECLAHLHVHVEYVKQVRAMVDRDGVLVNLPRTVVIGQRDRALEVVNRRAAPKAKKARSMYHWPHARIVRPGIEGAPDEVLDNHSALWNIGDGNVLIAAPRYR